MKNNSIIKWLLAFTIFLVCVSTVPNIATCSEEYYINNNKVLLYKIINWWYDSLPEESHRLCGSLIRCQTKGNIQIEYDVIEMKLSLNAKESFADLLSIFKRCEQCWGPSYLKLIYLNKEYFGDGKFITSTDNCSTVNSYVFAHIERTHAQKVQSIVDVIGFELDGVICGLVNGKIALHHAGTLLKTCQADSEKQGEDFPITLKIVNFQTEEILAKLSVVFDNKNHNQTFVAERKKRIR